MSFTAFFHATPSSSVPTVSLSSSKPKNPSTKLLYTKKQPKTPIKKLETLSARDTVIDFGKHKGKMLGTLPSTYLKWVSKNLRARDFEHWAKLADEVLGDPVYHDRIEWEFAEKTLQGSNKNMRNVISSSENDGNNAVSMLLEISERFGWDNEDKAGWSKVNFELLGTSKGGRIPRLTNVEDRVDYDVRNERRQKVERKEEVVNGGETRRERREKVRLRREAERKGKTESDGPSKVVSENAENVGWKNQVNDEEKQTGEIYNPFPGRESLLKKLLNRRRFS